MKPDLKVVPEAQPEKPVAPFDGKKCLRRIKDMRRKLLDESVRYVRESKEDYHAQRLRDASEASGISIAALENELKK